MSSEQTVLLITMLPPCNLFQMNAENPCTSKEMLTYDRYDVRIICIAT